jgi:hypothetical protein
VAWRNNATAITVVAGTSRCHDTLKQLLVGGGRRALFERDRMLVLLVQDVEDFSASRSLPPGKNRFIAAKEKLRR